MTTTINMTDLWYYMYRHYGILRIGTKFHARRLINLWSLPEASPIGMLRTDGKENLISSIDLPPPWTAMDMLVQRVCIYFDSYLYRGNCTTKYNAENFKAFRSANYPVLAQAGIHIRYYRICPLSKKWGEGLRLYLKMDTNNAILKIFPVSRPLM